jgi:HD-like signal output (HDOD) protein
VTTLAHKAHFRSDDPVKRGVLEMLWGHAVAVALAGKHIATLTGGDPEEAFVAGLLHDVGKLLVLKTVDHLEGLEETGDVTGVVLDELMDLLHTELGHTTLTSWNLPESLCEPALPHHDEDLEASQDLVIRIQAADAVAKKIGQHTSPEPELDLLELPSIDHLNLTDIDLATLMVDVEDEIVEIKRLF